MFGIKYGFIKDANLIQDSDLCYFQNVG